MGALAANDSASTQWAWTSSARRANESKRKKYDSADSMESAEKAIAFTSGEGDANNTFFASAGASGGAAKRQKIN